MDPNSYGSFVLGVLKAQLVDCASMYPELTKEFDRDYCRLSSAIEKHGIQFALVTMPDFRKHFDKCLENRRLIRSHLLHFGGYKYESPVPRLFRGLVLRVFDVTGTMRPVPDTRAIFLLRQILGSLRKLKMSCSHKDTASCVVEFAETDRSIRAGSHYWNNATDTLPEPDSRLSFTDNPLLGKSGDGDSVSPPTSILSNALKNCQLIADIITSHLGHYDPLEWKPRHGPGAVSDRQFGSNKYSFNNWPDRLECSFPYADLAFANYALVDYIHVQDSDLDFYREYPARLLAVPKTLKGPRLIASEPVANQWCQQIVRDYLYNRVAQTPIRNLISFRDQTLNGNLALDASHTSEHVTIDLSSASDRISCWHVERLFRRNPELLQALWASRSRVVQQNICRYTDEFIQLNKYSTMGNATIFPVQSLLFATLCLASWYTTIGEKPRMEDIRTRGNMWVRIFGDDIIVPKMCSGLLLELIEYLGLKVNPNKTFTEGNFRESCGVDAYDGYNVTAVNILAIPERTKPGSIVSTVDVHHNLMEKGLCSTAQYLQETATNLMGKTIRWVGHRSGLFGWSNLVGSAYQSRERYNRRLQIREVYSLSPKVTNYKETPKCSSGLLQFFIQRPEVVSEARSSLSYHTRRPKTKLSLRWVPVS